MPSIEAHIFPSELTSNNSKTRNVREPVSLITVTTNKLKDIRIANLNRIVISHININSVRNKF